MTMIKLLICLFSIVASSLSQADTFILPPADVDVIGQVETITAGRDDTLLDIARRYDLGQNEILSANPAVDRWLPEENSVVVLPNTVHPAKRGTHRPGAQPA